ncbi:hypothetical protein [Psychromicrobium lacuslunae]|uniref:Uncharacterized protein n=1 Tax=Psychromicrobium lacuslunae TaxID=1618207 RepID=A0A0D4BWP7_9MICC|nr:hypothetical protein [Psychromicrobium lacuslunae]AJT40535.1 hypothetical protein UM93_01430 [Psychromicrobium lacuslunae]
MTVLIIIGALLIAGFLGWPLTTLVLKLARSVDHRAAEAVSSEQATVAEPEPAVVAESTSADSVTAELNPAEPQKVEPGRGEQSGAQQGSAAASEVVGVKVLRGGLLIGILERLAVVLCLVFDQPVAIAYVIAVKGLGRYPELKESPAASERFIIGTLSSMIFATLIGIAARWLIGIL